MDALAFNKSQNINPDDLVAIQRTVGAFPDGIWGPRTVARITAWQTSIGRTADGRVDAATLKEFRARWAHDDDPSGDEGLDDLPDDDDPSPSASMLTVAPVEGPTLDDLVKSVPAALAAMQNDLFAFGFEPGLPDGQPGAKTRAALLAFQSAAKQSGRVVKDARTNVEPSFKGTPTGSWDQPTLDELRLWKGSGFRFVAAGAEYVERRVRVANYARLPRSSVNLVDITSVQDVPRRLHTLAAAALERMIAAAKKDKLDLRVQSGWRAHRWQSRQQYEEVLRARFGSVARGQRFLAFDSPHETGLAVDFGTEGLEPRSSTIPKQLKSPGFAWLKENAWQFGWHPYKNEPWHWEFPLSRRAWTTGDSDWI